MPTYIQISDSKSPVTDYAIERDVFRVGSGTSCELQIPGIDSHAMTVQYKRGQYVVFNRGSQPVVTGRERILPAQSGRWLPHEDLQIGADVTLRLQDATPGTRSETSHAQAGPAAECGESNAKRRQKLIVLAGAVIVAIVILGPFGGNAPSSAGASPECGKLIEDLGGLIAKDPAQHELIDLRSVLQEARNSEIRRDLQNASKSYELARKRIDEVRLPEHLKIRLLRFLRSHIEQVTSSSP
ncbi:MAG TPA: hypothetical protein VGP76_03635 [Planctomycetaceae bacterium]|jgi:hypothetical protein|nr:hypothetical protein [Planctomycetaceae bacterium]